MAEVWLGRRRGAGPMEKRVVIKRILRNRIRDPLMMKLFVSEAEISMALAHKNIVPTFDFGRVGDELFIVMEYVDGTNLAMALSRASELSAPLEPALVCHILFEACQALDFAHRYRDHSGKEQQIAHRDVSPANLLLSFSGEVKLTDFGLAAATADSSSDSSKPRGTPDYMAPEQFSGDFVGPSADLFSLGIILRELILLKKVRTGSAKEKRMASQKEIAPMPDTLPQELRDICEKATRFKQEDRYQSAREMAQALDGYLLRARVADSSNQTPMPERLANWLTMLFPDGSPSDSKIPGTEIEGSALTFLEHGADKLLGDDDGATMRSMEVTAVEAGVEEAKAPGPKELEEERTSDKGDLHDSFSEATADKPQGSFKRAFAPLALGLAGLTSAGLIVYIYFFQESNIESSPSPADAEEVAQVVRNRPVQPETIPVTSAPPKVDLATTTTAPIPVPDAGVVQRPAKPAVAISLHKTEPKAGPKAEPKVILRISSTPWATVRVKGRSESCDETPCRLTLPPGKYQLILHNPVADLKSTTPVAIEDGHEGPAKIHVVLR